MKTEFAIDNLKCGGCANTIRKALTAIPGISDARVDEEIGAVSFTYSDETVVKTAKEKLASIGYPESGTLEGFEKLSAGAKSYVSCAIGRMTKKEGEETK